MDCEEEEMWKSITEENAEARTTGNWIEDKDNARSENLHFAHEVYAVCGCEHVVRTDEGASAQRSLVPVAGHIHKKQCLKQTQKCYLFVLSI